MSKSAGEELPADYFCGKVKEKKKRKSIIMKKNMLVRICLLVCCLLFVSGCGNKPDAQQAVGGTETFAPVVSPEPTPEIGRASCRERV